MSEKVVGVPISHELNSLDFGGPLPLNYDKVQPPKIKTEDYLTHLRSKSRDFESKRLVSKVVIGGSPLPLKYNIRSVSDPNKSFNHHQKLEREGPIQDQNQQVNSKQSIAKNNNVNRIINIGEPLPLEYLPFKKKLLGPSPSLSPSIGNSHHQVSIEERRKESEVRRLQNQLRERVKRKLQNEPLHLKGESESEGEGEEEEEEEEDNSVVIHSVNAETESESSPSQMDEIVDRINAIETRLNELQEKQKKETSVSRRTILFIYLLPLLILGVLIGAA